MRSRGRLRLFWALMAAGIGLWFLYQFVWIYYEVWLHTDVPDMCAGDVVLFLHIVPLMAALALRPHAPEDEYAARLRRLDFVLMIVWWGFLYVLIVFPWQYVSANVGPYAQDLNSLYLIEKLAFLAGLAVAWKKSTGGWRIFYANLFGACLMYAISSHFANWAIGRHVYYSGSLYDIPLAVSMGWITVTGLWAPAPQIETDTRPVYTSYSVWLARVGMIAAFSLPVFAAWALLDTSVPDPVRSFRVIVTLAGALLMGMLVFVRQRLLDRELLSLLTHSRESLANLKRLQAQITESEKLASVGQLVGGVAHELNNPITAMLGYSDLLQCTVLTNSQKELVEKIGQNVRRTRSLVASLLSFAKQRPTAMATVDLNSLLRTAVKLTQPQWLGLKIEVNTIIPPGLLSVHGDSNQLLQVCVQLIDVALQAIHEKGLRNLTVAAGHCDECAVLVFCNQLADVDDIHFVHNRCTAETTEVPSSGLGMRACQEILRQHRGKLLWHEAGTTTHVRIEIPLIQRTPERSSEAEVPVLWQPQPSV